MANSPAEQSAARLAPPRRARTERQASTASESSCSHHCGWPFHGAAMDDGLRQARQHASANGASCVSASTRAVVAGAGETLNQRTAPPLVCSTTKSKPAEHVVLAALGHVAHLVRDQAADGVEVLLSRLVGDSLMPKASLTRSIGGVAADTR